MPLFCPFHANITFCKINAVTSLSLVIRLLSHSITNCALISFFNALSRTKHFRQKRLLRALRFLFRISCFYYIKARHLNKIFGMAFVLNITSIKKKPLFKGFSFIWCRYPELNWALSITIALYYHYTIPACFCAYTIIYESPYVYQFFFSNLFADLTKLF